MSYQIIAKNERDFEKVIRFLRGNHFCIWFAIPPEVWIDKEGYKALMRAIKKQRKKNER